MRKIIKLYEHKDQVFDVEDGVYIDNPKTLALCDDGTVWILNYTADNGLNWDKLPDIPQDEVMFGKSPDFTPDNWVSVDDKLPELDDGGFSQSVLLYGSEVFSNDKHRFVGYCEDGVFYTSTGIEMRVTHWRLLPDYPKM